MKFWNVMRVWLIALDNNAMFNHFKLYTAGLIGLPDLLPAYLDPKFHGPRILTGASFASAGAGYYDMTSLSVVSIWHYYDITSLSVVTFLFII